MNELYSKYLGMMTKELVLAVAGNPVKSGEGLPSKVRIKPVMIRGELMFQATKTVGTKEIHDNLTAESAAEFLAACADIADETVLQHFRQIEIKNGSAQVVTMVSKKGKLTVKEHKIKTVSDAEEKASGSECGNESDASRLSNNRKKQYVLEEGTPVPFLVELGVMTKDGKVVKARYDKFRQINRYLEFVEDIIPSLPAGREISIIDFGCGKSYLTFALYYYLHEKKGFDVKITGLDLKSDVIANCNALAKRFGYEKLEFLHGDIADYTGTDSVDMVVTLHACDTATDYALFKAISWNARVIFCVPCCQHELNKQIKDDARASIMKYGLIKERIAALYTDAVRANILEEQGYKTQILEFIDMEHTPKNILIRATKTGKQMLPKSAKNSSDRKGPDYKELLEELGAELTLNRLLNTKK